MSFKINIIKDKLLSENWFVLRNYTYEITDGRGEVIRHKREVYDRGNGATILLYNREKNSVVLTRQFRIATYVNGNEGGMLIEACAGLLDDDSPEDCIRKEAIEETGYAVGDVEKLYACYMSPGGVTELIHFSQRNIMNRCATMRAAVLKMSRSMCWNCLSLMHWQWSPMAAFATAKPSCCCSMRRLLAG